MGNEETESTGARQRWAWLTCVALVMAAIGDAGPEIYASRSLFAHYDGPGPLIYLGVAAMVATVRWRFTPLLAVAVSALFLVGGFLSPDFVHRLTHPGSVAFFGGWLQMLAFAAAIVCGTAAVSGFGDRFTTRFASVPMTFKLSLAGLVVGIAGLVIQWFANPGKFHGFPPGIAVIAAFGGLTTLLVGRWWAPVFAVFIGLWIDVGGWAAGQVTPNFRSGNTATIIGLVVMLLGLAAAAVTGIMAMVTTRRVRKGAPAR
jgi:hypothetical protein